MYITDLKVENARSIKKADIKLQKGINIFSGKPGQGKSTLIEMVRLLLINSVKTSLKEIPSWDSDKKTFSAFGIFHHGDHVYKIDGKFSGSTFNRKLFIDDNNDMSLDNTDCLNELKNRFDFELLEYSVFSFQNDNQITTLTPAKRREVVKKLFNAEFPDIIIEIENDVKETKLNIDSINIEIKALESKDYIYQDLLPLPFEEIKYKEYIIEKLELEKAINSYQIKLNEYNSSILEQEEIIKKIKELTDSYNYLDKEIVSLDIEIKAKKDTIENTDFFEEVNLKQKEFDETNWNLTIDNFNLQIENLNKEKSSIVINRIRPYSGEEREEEINKLLIKANSDSLDILRHRQLALEGKCSHCGTQLGESYSLNTTKELEDIQKIIEGYKQELSKLQKEKQEYLNAVETNKNLQLNIDNINSQITVLDDKIKTELVYIESRKVSLLQSIQQLRDNAEYKKLNIQKDIDSQIQIIQMKRTTIFEVTKDLQEYQIKLDKIKIIQKPDPVTEQETKLSVIISNCKQYDDIVIKNEERNSFNKKLKAIEIEDLNKLKNKREQQQNLNKTLAIQDRSKSFYKVDLPNYISNTRLQAIEKNMNKFMLEAYNSRYIIKIEEDKKKTGINILYGKSLDKLADVSNASGFESSLLKMSWMVGLMRLSDMNILVLDEIDSASDKDFAIAVYTLIGEYAKKLDQLILISHKPEVREFLVENYNAKEFLVDKGTVQEV